ncbi:ATP-binding protein [Polycyclovorans algicola]|uniref:ATP-binding protein n=1 Tax=Polycyclovorans algicola TaxID=616992 RepID=UPI000A7C58D3|nr:ATP-binding protein [Polycyclovorans algicola]
MSDSDETMGLDYPAARAWRWRDGHFQAIAHLHRVDADGLLGIDRVKSQFLDNLAQFVAGHPANHTLLTGARGTGKSSLVKAGLARFADAGLRGIEVSPHDLTDLPDIVAPLRDREERYLLYVDDFTVGRHDPALTALKTALDGGLDAPVENVLIVATSNRRYLMPSLKSDNEEYRWENDELHPGESTESTVSLSERFGLWLSFHAFSQAQYLDAVRHHLQSFGHAAWDDELAVLAQRWALMRGSRSGRVAQQFARDVAGKAQMKHA